MQRGVGCYREVSRKAAGRCNMEQMRYCALVSNPQAGRPVRGHDVEPSSLKNPTFNLTAENLDMYFWNYLRRVSARVRRRFVGSPVSEREFKNKVWSGEPGDWLAGLIFANGG